MMGIRDTLNTMREICDRQRFIRITRRRYKTWRASRANLTQSSFSGFYIGKWHFQLTRKISRAPFPERNTRANSHWQQQSNKEVENSHPINSSQLRANAYPRVRSFVPLFVSSSHPPTPTKWRAVDVSWQFHPLDIAQRDCKTIPRTSLEFK